MNIIWNLNNNLSPENINSDEKYKEWLKNQFWYNQINVDLNFNNDKKNELNNIAHVLFLKSDFIINLCSKLYPQLFYDFNKKLSDLKQKDNSVKDLNDLTYENSRYNVIFEDNYNWNITVLVSNSFMYQLNDKIICQNVFLNETIKYKIYINLEYKLDTEYINVLKRMKYQMAKTINNDNVKNVSFCIYNMCNDNYYVGIDIISKIFELSGINFIRSN